MVFKWHRLPHGLGKPQLHLLWSGRGDPSGRGVQKRGTGCPPCFGIDHRDRVHLVICLRRGHDLQLFGSGGCVDVTVSDGFTLPLQSALT